MKDGSKPIQSLRCLREVIEAIAWERTETRIAALENQLLRAGEQPRTADDAMKPRLSLVKRVEALEAEAQNSRRSTLR